MVIPGARWGLDIGIDAPPFTFQVAIDRRELRASVLLDRTTPGFFPKRTLK